MDPMGKFTMEPETLGLVQMSFLLGFGLLRAANCQLVCWECSSSKKTFCDLDLQEFLQESYKFT